MVFVAGALGAGQAKVLLTLNGIARVAVIRGLKLCVAASEGKRAHIDRL
jgi:hypothetical protein